MATECRKCGNSYGMLGGSLEPGVCHQCFEQGLSEDNQPSLLNEDQEAAPSTDLFSQVVNGDYGLATTYWVYGFLAALLWAVAIAAISPEPGSTLFKAVFFLFAVYYIIVYTGIWNAASKYKGPKVWAIISKFHVLMAAIPSLIFFIKWAFK